MDEKLLQRRIACETFFFQLCYVSVSMLDMFSNSFCLNQVTVISEAKALPAEHC